MKILFTSVGRRVELVQAFRTAARELNVDLKIIGVDISNNAPALYFCDKQAIICRISDEEYVPSLLSLCKKERVDCVIPTIDTDLLTLAENKEKFEKIGTKVLISEPEKIRICRDKTYTSDYFLSLGLKAPEAVDCVAKYQEKVERGEGYFPAFIKPKDGSSSVDAYRADNLAELELFAKKIGEYVIQPFIQGTEYTIDIFCDMEGNPVYITPRERLAVRAGEVLKTKITQNDEMIAQMQTLIADFKPCGAITVQLIHDEGTGENYYIEINPRFGGGAPISMRAGADSAKALLKILRGDSVRYEYKAATHCAVYCRFDQTICVSRVGK